MNTYEEDAPPQPRRPSQRPRSEAPANPTNFGPDSQPPSTRLPPIDLNEEPTVIGGPRRTQSRNRNRNTGAEEAEPDEEHEPPPELSPEMAMMSAFVTQLTTAMGETWKRNSQVDSVKYKLPDTFDGKNPEAVRNFLDQVGFYVTAKPKSFDSERAQVMFAMSYLRGDPQEWFYSTYSSYLRNHNRAPSWLDSFSRFERELLLNFGPPNLKVDAGDWLSQYEMGHNDQILGYLAKFNNFSAVVGWDEPPLVHNFYRGLPSRLKDYVTQKGKPERLSAMKALAREGDIRFWERRKEEERRKKRNPTPSSGSNSNPSNSSSGSNSSNNSSSNNSSGSGNNGGRNRRNKPRNDNNNNASSSNQSNSASSAGPSNASSISSFLSGKLGKDGKLTPEERKRRMDNKLCMFCAKPGHMAKDCRKASSSASKARAANVAPAADAVPEPEKD